MNSKLAERAIEIQQEAVAKILDLVEDRMPGELEPRITLLHMIGIELLALVAATLKPEGRPKLMEKGLEFYEARIKEIEAARKEKPQ